jgi:hypothetical protein
LLFDLRDSRERDLPPGSVTYRDKSTKGEI